jgi:TonB-dependent receptor
LEAGIELSEVLVSGQLQGQSKALNTQMNKGNITNIISSDQVGRFPDANIGDALKRIPGINVQYDQGEARFGNIRGTAPQYNSVMVNGERIPSAEAEDRTVQLDLVPADMVQSIEVNKAVTPDMDADAIGGAVNLVTRSAPYDRRVSLTLGSGYNILAGKPIYNGAFVLGDRFFNNKLGIIASASYYNHQLGSDNFEAEWDYMDDDNADGSAFTEEIQIRQYYLQRIRQSYSLSLDYKLNANHTLFLNGIYNHRNDWENRYRSIYTDIEFDDEANSWEGELRKETKGGNPETKNARLEDQRMMNFTLGGDHQFGKIKADWTASYSKASEERPNERYISYRQKGVAIIPDFSDKSLPRVSAQDSKQNELNADYSLREITEEFQLTEDIDKNFKLNFFIPMLENEFKNSLKIGVRYKGKEKMRNNKLFEYSPADEDAFNTNTMNNLENFTKDNFLVGDYATGKQVSAEYLGSLDLTNSTLFEEEQIAEAEAGDFNAIENIFGGYLMLNQNIGSKLSMIAGVRIEHTSQEYQGNQYDADEDENTLTDKVADSYINILPGLHLKYDFNKTTILRAAWTNTLARPNYFSLVPYREINREDNEIAIGNPELTPTTAMNFDLMFEKYFKTIGIVSAGVFYKDIKDFIVTETREDYLFDGTTWDTYSQPINGGNATIFGFEASAQRQLDFLPGFWKGFGLYANYTYTTSSVSDFRIEGREDDDDISLPGTAKHTLNGSLSYDNKRFSFRTSVNYSSAFVDEFGEEAFYDRYYNEAIHLDVNATYAITPKFRIYAEANNLLNTPLYYYQGISSRLMQAEYYNARFQFGVKFDF